MAQKNRLTTADHLPYDEYERLLKCLRDDKDYLWELYARVAFCTACRVSDVRQLRWLDIVDRNETVITEQKTGKTRKIRFNQSVRRKLTELWHLMGEPNKALFVFTGRKQENPYSIQYINTQLKRIKYKYALKIGNFSTHTFRKTFGRYVYDTHGHSAESLLLLNKILNHSNIETTKAYIGITQGEINSLYDSIKF